MSEQNDQVDWAGAGKAQALCEVIVLLRESVDKLDRWEVVISQGGRISDNAAGAVFADVRKKLAELEQEVANELAGCHEVIGVALYDLLASPASENA